METQQVENIKVGILASIFTTVDFTLSGISASQVLAIQNLIARNGGFFIAPYCLTFSYVAHILITGILIQVTYNVGRLAYYSFKAAYNNASPDTISSMNWHRVII